jgi:hypothetical protein
MEVSSQIHTLFGFTPGEQPPVHIVQEAGWAHIHSGRYGEDKNLLHLPVIEPRLFGRRASSQVAIPTQLSWLPYNRPTYTQFCDMPYVVVQHSKLATKLGTCSTVASTVLHRWFRYGKHQHCMSRILMRNVNAEPACPVICFNTP